MADDDRPDGVRAHHLATVQAWRAQVPVDGGPPLDGVVVQFGTDAGDLAPLLVPVDAVPGLVGVLLDAAGLGVDPDDAGSGLAGPPATPTPPIADAVGGAAWAALVGTGRVGVATLDRSTVPSGPGAYAWFRDGTPVHLGRAVGKRGLRARIGGDALRGDADLARSPFRAEVAGHLGLDVDRAEGRLPPEGVAAVDAWIDGCEVAWRPSATAAAAAEDEAALRAEHDPSLGDAPPPSSARLGGPRSPAG